MARRSARAYASMINDHSDESDHLRSIGRNVNPKTNYPRPTSLPGGVGGLGWTS